MKINKFSFVEFLKGLSFPRKRESPPEDGSVQSFVADSLDPRLKHSGMTYPETLGIHLGGCLR
jgi:hypothetical protein